MRSCGGHLVSADGRALVLHEMRVEAVVLGSLSRTRLTQHFRNPYEEPLDLTLHVPLPADGAVAGYAVQLGANRLVGHVEPRSAARAAYEEAVLEGRLAALLQEERSSVFTQAIGNVPPRTDVSVEIDVEHPLAWLAEGSWEWRFPTTLAPRYLGMAGRVDDAHAIAVEVAEGGPTPNVSVRLRFDGTKRPADISSPSHAIRVNGDDNEAIIDGALPDRDLAVRWSAASTTPGVNLVVARPSNEEATYGVVTIVPPLTGVEAIRRRDVVILIDASGSMRGGPIAQAKAIVRCVANALDHDDALELVAFADESMRWSSPAGDGPEVRQAGMQAWLDELEVGGATEMTTALSNALAPAAHADGERHVILVTDGLVGFEDEVIDVVRTALSERDGRVHSVAIGPAPNRTLTSSVARAGGGVEIVVGLDDDPDVSVTHLLAGMSATVVTDIEITGSAVAELASPRTPDLLAQRPTRIPIRLTSEGGEVVVTGITSSGPFRTTLSSGACERGSGDPAIARAFGRERVEALEMGEIVVEDGDAGHAIEGIGCQFQIATRRTSWVAMTEEPVVRPGEPSRQERVPSMLPAGLCAEGLGLRAATAPGEIPVAEGALAVRGAPPSPTGLPTETPATSFWRSALLVVLVFVALATIVVGPRIREFLNTLVGRGQTTVHESPAKGPEAP